MWGISQIPTSPTRQVEQAQVEAVFGILEDWFSAVEDGTAHHRLPDPGFVPPPGRPAITEDLVEGLVAELDRELDMDAFGVQGRKYEADASCEFHRLAYPQRVALVQQLMATLLTDQEIAELTDPDRADIVSAPAPEAA